MPNVPLFSRMRRPAGSLVSGRYFSLPSALLSGLLLLAVHLSAPSLLISVSWAQRGDARDKAGAVQRLLIDPKLIPPSPVLSPAEALQSFQLAPGFRIDVVAHEPLVQDPVAALIGPDGRLWVVEMRGYMNDLEGSTEDAPVGRISVLSDTDGDGRYDRSDVFLDGLVMPRAVGLVADGVLVGEPPYLKFWRDTDGDGKADQSEIVTEDYGVKIDPKIPGSANPEAAPNGLYWGMDNWIYNVRYDKRIRYQQGRWEIEHTLSRGQWGITQDDFGRLLYNTNARQLMGDLIPPHYLARNPHHRPAAGASALIALDQSVWPIRVTPGLNRGYQPNMISAEGKLLKFTAASGPWIYRADLFPEEFYGNAFVPEPAANLVKRNLLFRENGGLIAKNAYEQKEFLTSTDERFRPVNFFTGPDGALYIVDLYRGVIQHHIALTTYLRRQSEERGLVQPIHLGRIYRVAPEGHEPQAFSARMHQETPAQWVQHLSKRNSWWRETAQRLLVERGDRSAVPALRQLVVDGREPVGRVHALWTLDGLEQLDWASVASGLQDPADIVRVAAVRLSERFFAGNDKPKALAALYPLAKDRSPEVRLQLTLTLGEARQPAADLALIRLARANPQIVFIRDAAYSGLAGRELAWLDRLLTYDEFSPLDTEANQFLSGLVKCIFVSRNLEQASRVWTLIAAQPPRRQAALLDGVVAAATLPGATPLAFVAEPRELAALSQSADNAVRIRLAKLNDFIVWPGKTGLKAAPAVAPLTAAERARFDQGKLLYPVVCGTCHQATGLGAEGLAPPLADSEWVNGPSERLIRIMLQGVRGPLTVAGRTYNMDMPGFGGFYNDEQVAALATYIAREWGNHGRPVEPALVTEIRSQTAQRADAWTEAELLRIP